MTDSDRAYKHSMEKRYVIDDDGISFLESNPLRIERK